MGNLSARQFIGLAAAIIGLPLATYSCYTHFVRPDRTLSDAVQHVFMESKGASGKRDLFFNIVNFDTGEAIATGSYHDRGRSEHEQLRFGDSGEVFFKLAETNQRESFNRKIETKNITVGSHSLQVETLNQYHFGGPKLTEIIERVGGNNQHLCTLEEYRGKFWGFRDGVKVSMGDELVLLRSYDSDWLNFFGGIEANERVDVYNGKHHYTISIDHALFDVRQHGKNFIWDLKGVALLDERGVKRAEVKVKDSLFLNQPLYEFTINGKTVGRIIRDETIRKHYRSSTDSDGDTIEIEEKEKREVANGLYVMEGTDVEQCSMILTLLCEKLIQLRFDYKQTWMDFGLDLLKLSEHPDNPEYGLHLPLDMNLTPPWIMKSLETVFGYEAPEEFTRGDVRIRL